MVGGSWPVAGGPATSRRRPASGFGRGRTCPTGRRQRPSRWRRAVAANPTPGRFHRIRDGPLRKRVVTDSNGEIVPRNRTTPLAAATKSDGLGPAGTFFAATKPFGRPLLFLPPYVHLRLSLIFHWSLYSPFRIRPDRDLRFGATRR